MSEQAKNILFTSQPLAPTDGPLPHHNVHLHDTSHEAEIRGSLQEFGVQFLPRERLVYLPSIITNLYHEGDIIQLDGNRIDRRILPKLNEEQIRKIVSPTPEANYDFRVEMAMEALQTLASYLAGELMPDNFTNHRERDPMKRTLEVKQPNYEQVYKRNQLRGGTLAHIIPAFGTLSRALGNEGKIGNLTRDEIQQSFRQWALVIEEAIKGKEVDPSMYELTAKDLRKTKRGLTKDGWETYSNGEKIRIIQGVNNIILIALNMLSEGMEESNSLIYIT